MAFVYSNYAYFAVALVATFVDVILYFTSKDKFFCDRNILTGNCNYDRRFLIILWLTSLVFYPIWLYLLSLMKPYALKEMNEASAEKGLDIYSKQ